MSVFDDLKEIFERRECLIQKTERTEEEQAELRYLTDKLARALPVDNALALVQDEMPTRRDVNETE